MQKPALADKVRVLTWNARPPTSLPDGDMYGIDQPIRRRSRYGRGTALLLALSMTGCSTSLPSANITGQVRLPVPNGNGELPGPERLSRVTIGEALELTPLKLIRIAFTNRPEIKSSYQRFKQEEARYDFFVASRDSLTPRVRTRNNVSEFRDPIDVERDRRHTLEFSVEKRFFDTTELDVGVGVRSTAVNEALGSQPFLTASLRYPLWVSRQKLERTSEEIFRRNELNDAQLDYIQSVRERLQRALFSFYNVLRQERQLQNTRRWQADLVAIMSSLDGIGGRDLRADRRRVQAEIARAGAQERELAGRYEIDIERLKRDGGLPFHTKIKLVDEPFNPFRGGTHEALLHLSIKNDPEIATLRNEVTNAEVQLDLARRGRWDVMLELDGASNLEGGGETEGISDWAVGVGLNVAMVDPRVTGSLLRQAQANISRFAQAIIARENEIFVDTLEPVIRIESLGQSRDDLVENLPRFEEDYRNGTQEYRAGSLNIDDLLNRRVSLLSQEQEIARLTQMVGSNVSELCEVTGKFFEILGAGDDG